MTMADASDRCKEFTVDAVGAVLRRRIYEPLEAVQPAVLEAQVPRAGPWKCE